MVSQPEFGRPAERRNKVPCYHIRRRPVRPCDPSWGREGDSRRFDSHTGDRTTRDVRHGPLKEGWEEGIPHFILYRLKGHPYVQGDALHEGPLLL